MSDIKVGVYIGADGGLSMMIDMDELQKAVKEKAQFDLWKTYETFDCDKIESEIKKDIADQGINRVVIGGPSGRYFDDRFKFSADVLVERIPLREYIAWMQNKDDDKDDEIAPLAADYLRMAVTKLRNIQPPEPHIEAELSRVVLVIGGGVAGLSAAIGAADAGYDVHLVEKQSELGGWAKKFKAIIPTTTPYHELEKSPHTELVNQVKGNKRIKVHTSSVIDKISGQPGQFDVAIKNGNVSSVKIGAIVQASGWKPYDPNKLADKYGYGKLPNVVTNIAIEEMVSNGGIARPSDKKAPKSVAIVHCAGSRDKEHLAYCSAVCCRVALKQALYIREQLPNTDVYLLYKDIRTPGLYEEFYKAVQEQNHVFLVKGDVIEVAAGTNSGVKVTLENTLAGENLQVDAELLVLATGMVPSAKPDEHGEAELFEGVPAENTEGDVGAGARSAEQGAHILNLKYRLGTDLPQLKYGFPDSHFICFPYETRRTGIYAAGTVRAPMDISSSIKDGYGAALKAIQCIEAVHKGVAVHPRVNETAFPEFFLQRCTQCKRCTEECPFSMLEEDVKGTPLPNINRCRRCGICMGACPERIISFKNYSPNMVSQMIKVIDMPDEFDEKPRVLCFMCENDAIPALDIAASHHHRLNPIVRIIPVRCLGSVNTVWIADALSGGFDGILLLGCKPDDDYQCHFIKGSELAAKRMDNISEKLKQLSLEKERVQIHTVELKDWDKVAGMINDFADEIRDMGLNPYKGF